MSDRIGRGESFVAGMRDVEQGAGMPGDG